MSIQSTKDLLHHKIESTDDDTTLMFYLYVVNQLLTDQPDYTFLDDADLSQLVPIATLVNQADLHSGITSSVIDEKLMLRTHID